MYRDLLLQIHGKAREVGAALASEPVPTRGYTRGPGPQERALFGFCTNPAQETVRLRCQQDVSGLGVLLLAPADIKLVQFYNEGFRLSGLGVKR